ncbi:MAG: galactofuranosyltransferase [Muribaculaceae bacterium]|nr:galactofuranosyltransferase [Muribaculaceae bacterium]
MGSGGDKAKTDVEAIMDSLGYVNIGLPQQRSKNSVKAYIVTLLSVLKGVRELKKGDTLVLQYPLKKYYDFVVKHALGKGARVITVLHDLGSFRRKKLTVEEEVKRLNLSDAIIIHSPAMQQWLREHGVTTKLVQLGLWDYLSDASPASPVPSASGRPRLVFAGNVSPRANGWLYDLASDSPDVDLILYGKGIDQTRMTPNIIAKGFVDSDTLIAGAQGEYGLVWYGTSLDEGAGPLGEYLQYNAPHKLSLYLRAGLPVIIWEKAGLAPVVKELGIGITVPSLRGIGDILHQITPDQYTAMRRNVSDVAKKLASGHFVSKALKECCNDE